MDVREKAKNNKRLIDANKLIDFIDVGHLRHPGELCYSEVDVANILLHAPTVDAVPVVRCRECKWWHEDDDVGHCDNPDGLDNYAKPDDFCSYGERKDDDGNG